MNEQLELAIAAYHDGTLDGDGAQLLTQALRGDGAAAVRASMALDGLIGQAFVSDADAQRSIAERLAAESSASTVVRAVQRSLGRRQRAPSPWPARLAVAALLLVALGGAWWAGLILPPAAEECRVASGHALVGRGSATLATTAGAVLRSGDRLASDGAVALVWADGSRLELGPATQVRVVRPGTGPGLVLERGTLEAEIARQRPGLPFAIATAEARIEVLGTHFIASAQAQRTQVDLFTGVVRMTRLADGGKVILQGMETATIAADTEFAAHALSEPVAAAAAPAAAPAPALAPVADGPAWTPLFAADGLGGWRQQHGTWTWHDGTVRGEAGAQDAARPAGAQDAARLLGAQDYQDVELACRLRVSGAPVAEIQVGDYNWFAEIPARDGAWVAVALTQRGADLRVTVDGAAVPLQPGAGLAPRAGPLGFYIRQGGTLEIDSARVRVPAATPR